MKKIGLKDIAKHIGVSTALVSYVLNGQAEEKQVGKEVAEKIRKAAAELNYRPNHIAKSLKMRKTHTIGLIVADINYRFSVGITRAIEEEAKRNNYTVIFGNSNESSVKFAEVLNVLMSRQVDGLILVPVAGSEASIVQLQKSEIPFVLIDRNFPAIRTNSILLDNYKAAYDSTVHLIEQGHRRIAFVNYKSEMHNLLERDRGYLAALEDFKLPHPAEWLVKIDAEQAAKDIEAGVARLVKEESCDAIFFATDRLAIEGLRQVNRLHVRVPEEVSIFSFDEAEAFELFSCPISHARQPLEKMGKMAVGTLMQLLDHTKVINQVYMETDFVFGRSCRE